MPLNLSRIELRSGPRAGEPPLQIPVSTVTIFVGPNNSGKSLALRDIEQWCIGSGSGGGRVVNGVEAQFPTDPSEAEEMLSKFSTPPPPGHAEAPDMAWVGQHTFRPDQPVEHYQVSLPALRQSVIDQDFNHLRQLLLRPYTVRLDGRTRFALSDPKQTGDLQLAPQNHLWALFQDDEARAEVRRLTAEAFNLHFVIDPTAMTQFRIGMSSREPLDLQEEQALDQRAREFHSQATPISELSDGVQAFTGLVSALMSLPHAVLLVDEPEAFLHPVLARRLGNNLARVASLRSASLLAATHSASFLMGCLESAPQTTIVRLTYERESATARSLPASRLKELMLDPLLRSTGALNGLFHRAVVVTEADADRVFYDEINRRLEDQDRGISDCLFLNAQNWQTVPRVIAPLRQLGIPAVAVIDLDALFTSGSWGAFYEAAGLEIADQHALEALRARCIAYANDLPELADGRKAYKVNGLEAFQEPARSDIERLVEELSEFGIFLVPEGELEGWLHGLGISAPKRQWVVRALGRLGSNPSDSSYVTPADDDVWMFVDSIGRWCSNQARRGMP